MYGNPFSSFLLWNEICLSYRSNAHEHVYRYVPSNIVQFSSENFTEKLKLNCKKSKRRVEL